MARLKNEEWIIDYNQQYEYSDLLNYTISSKDLTFHANSDGKHFEINYFDNLNPISFNFSKKLEGLSWIETILRSSDIRSSVEYLKEITTKFEQIKKNARKKGVISSSARLLYQLIMDCQKDFQSKVEKEIKSFIKSFELACEQINIIGVSFRPKANYYLLDLSFPCYNVFEYNQHEHLCIAITKGNRDLTNNVFALMKKSDSFDYNGVYYWHSSEYHKIKSYCNMIKRLDGQMTKFDSQILADSKNPARKKIRSLLWSLSKKYSVELIDQFLEEETALFKVEKMLSE